MARLEDYVKTDSIESEITQAAEAQADRAEVEIPSRFAEKSREEIAASYAELEQAFSRQGNDLGTMRKQVDELVGLQLQTTSEQEQTPAVTLDNLYDDADGTIQKVAERVTNSRIEGLEQKLAEAEREKAMGVLSAEHPEWQKDMQTPEFQNWVAEKPYRARLAQQADTWDFDAAGDLFGMYYGEKQPKQPGNVQREQQLRDATLETSTAAAASFDDTYSRADLMSLRIRAKAGDEEAKSYLRNNGQVIQQAYADGRIVD
tara:strand:- start:3585 stop:4364 length:780 start_codon:yes stop_codon:yes gene_type:complete